MIRQYLIGTSNKEAVLAAARAFGAQTHVRAFTRGDLEGLKNPLLVIIDSGRVDGLDADMLQVLRRTNRGGMRYSPFLVFCQTRREIDAWRAAGAVAVHPTNDRAALKKAIQEALDGERAWVTSATYVGPCRRGRKAILNLRKRRAADAEEAETARREKARKASPVLSDRVFSLDVLLRRLTLSATLLSGSTIESRRAFRDLVDELQVSAQAHNRGDLSGVIANMRREADAFVQDGQRSTGALERMLSDLRTGIERVR